MAADIGTLPPGPELDAAIAEKVSSEFTEWLEFAPAPPNPKTKVWNVLEREHEGMLGIISWFGAWRRYSFFPCPQTVFEPTCLRDIANFCERKTTEHKAAR